MLATDNSSEGSNFAIDPKGRYVAGVQLPEGWVDAKYPIACSLWVVDLRRGAVVKRRTYSIMSLGFVASLMWRGSALYLAFGDEKPRLAFRP